MRCDAMRVTGLGCRLGGSAKAFILRQDGGLWCFGSGYHRVLLVDSKRQGLSVSSEGG